MDPSTVTFALLVLLGGSSAQYSVTQEPSVTATPGQTVKIPCTLRGGLTVSSNCIRFYQQKLGQSPRHLFYFCSESLKGKGSGVPDRFVGSGSGSVGYLTITGVQAEDDADYHCATMTGYQCTVTQVQGEVRLKSARLWGQRYRWRCAGPAGHTQMEIAYSVSIGCSCPQ